MPQMSPMWWTFIMIVSIFLLMMTISINYFNYNNIINNKKLNNKKQSIVWKW